jgi:hypothetical protein
MLPAVADVIHRFVSPVHKGHVFLPQVCGKRKNPAPSGKIIETCP